MIPVADFTGDTGNGTIQVVEHFTDLSVHIPTSWHWQKSSDSGVNWVDFDTAPTVQNPTETLDIGVWSIRLTASNGDGPDTKTVFDYVTVFAAPPLPSVVVSADGFTWTLTWDGVTSRFTHDAFTPRINGTPSSFVFVARAPHTLQFMSAVIVLAGDSCTLDYTPGLVTIDAALLQPFSGASVDNQSTQ